MTFDWNLEARGKRIAVQNRIFLKSKEKNYIEIKVYKI